MAGGELARALSNAMVHLHREHFGRGPGSAKSFVLDDLVLCVMSDVFTQTERALLDAGERKAVRDTRHLHQLAMEAEFRAAVEKLTGRSVSGFVSTVGFDPDVAVEIFFLRPEGQGQAATISAARA
jgi:uncharacterized protein YbcI